MKRAIYVDVSGSMTESAVRVGLMMGLDLLRCGEGHVLILDARGEKECSPSEIEKLLANGVYWGTDGLFGGGTAFKADTVRWADHTTILVTDGDTPDSLSECFDHVLVVKSPKEELAREVMAS